MANVLIDQINIVEMNGGPTDNEHRSLNGQSAFGQHNKSIDRMTNADNVFSVKRTHITFDLFSF